MDGAHGPELPRQLSPSVRTRSDALDSFESRSFLQQRLATLVAMACVLVILLGGLRILVDAPSPAVETAPLASQATTLHLVVALALFATWLHLRYAASSLQRLVLLDTTITACSGAVLAGMMYATGITHETLFGHVLVITHVLVARAALVPSGAPRTAALGAFATVPIVLMTYEVSARAGARLDLPSPLFTMGIATVAASLAVASATVVSAVVYGLREKFREAMQLGRYTIEHKLGEGGMGVVFKARHAFLRRPTAVKLLPAEKAGGESLARFQREVQITATLTHPNTIAVYDYGHTPGGTFYYAMEYVEGITLQRLVDDFGPQPPGRVIHVLRQVCGALYEAHCAGLVHRDVKPLNIMLSHRGQVADFVKVVDFGLVKEIGTSLGATFGRREVMAGTPLYLSPEAIASPHAVGAKSDLYALGAVGYFLLTGSPPFSADSALELCMHHLHTPPEPPAAKLKDSVAPDLEKILLACLAKDPADRPQDAHELSMLLAGCSAAATWTERDARAWWEQHAARSPDAMQPRTPATPPVDPSFVVPVELERRRDAA